VEFACRENQDRRSQKLQKGWAPWGLKKKTEPVGEQAATEALYHWARKGFRHKTKKKNEGKKNERKKKLKKEREHLKDLTRYVTDLPKSHSALARKKGVEGKAQ